MEVIIDDWCDLQMLSRTITHCDTLHFHTTSEKLFVSALSIGRNVTKLRISLAPSNFDDLLISHDLSYSTFIIETDCDIDKWHRVIQKYKPLSVCLKFPVSHHTITFLSTIDSLRELSIVISHKIPSVVVALHKLLTSVKLHKFYFMPYNPYLYKDDVNTNHILDLLSLSTIKHLALSITSNEILSHLATVLPNTNISHLDISELYSINIDPLISSPKLKHLTFSYSANMSSISIGPHLESLHSRDICQTKNNNLTQSQTQTNQTNISHNTSIYDSNILEIIPSVKPILVRNRMLRWENTHSQLLSIAIIILQLYPTIDPYIILYIFDWVWVPTHPDINHNKKINLIYAIKKSISVKPYIGVSV